MWSKEPNSDGHNLFLDCGVPFSLVPSLERATCQSALLFQWKTIRSQISTGVCHDTGLLHG